MVIFGYTACAISFTHLDLGPVPHVDTLLQGKAVFPDSDTHS